MIDEIPKISAIIRDARNEQKLSQTALAKKAGITKRTVSSIETEKSQPKFDVLYKLVRILGISTEHIFWPENTRCTPEQKKICRALQACDEPAQAIYMDIACAYIQAVNREKGAKKQTVTKPSDF